MNSLLPGSLAAIVFTTAAATAADPRVDTWFTQNSALYARIYRTTADEAAGNAVTTWSRGQGTQSLPVYAGVREIYSSANWVYIRSSGLASYVMGPWYLDAGKTQLFPNYPANTRVLYRIPRQTGVPAAKTLTGLGAIGYFVNGVALFDSRDAFYWNGTGEVMGSGLWNRDAYVNESVTFDAALAHQAGANHHYHANPIALRYQLGDHVDYNSANNRYSEGAGVPAKHSPIVAWVRDGFPIYGPYGYSNPTNPASGVRRMVAGFVPRNGQNGTANLAAIGRTTLPAWAARAYNRSTTLAATEYGPGVSAQYPLGRYLEDNDFLGDLGRAQGTDFDLDEYNGRFCVTPEFPAGTYAYFVAITASGAPAFPYNVGRSFYGAPSGGTLTSVGETVATNFIGGANAEARLSTPLVTNGVVTLTWSATEGGTYRVDSTTNLAQWGTNIASTNAVRNRGRYIGPATNLQSFYRVGRTALATFDTN
ncbi:MAG TPA: YHYH protein [Verrucomicrobiae bacterium]|nr:YHYH protein [Verrucomicrobiae bacterium]